MKNGLLNFGCFPEARGLFLAARTWVRRSFRGCPGDQEMASGVFQALAGISRRPGDGFGRRLGAYWAFLGRPGAILGRLEAVLEASWGVLGPSWGRFGTILRPSWTVLGCLEPTGEHRMGKMPKFKKS